MAPKDLREQVLFDKRLLNYRIDLCYQELLIIKESLLELEGSFSGLLQGGKESRIEKGSYVRSVFANFVDPAVVQCLDLLVDYLSNLVSTTFSAKGRGVTRLLDFLRGVFNEQVKVEDLETLYKVYIMLDKGKGDEGNEGCNFFKSKSKNVVFNLWCFSPGFNMQRLSKLDPQSIILTSGTLSPLQSTAEEVGIPFSVQLENQHVVNASQVWCGVLATGIDKIPLNSSFKTRSDPKYLNSLGMSVISLIKMVPAGVLVFFPSYSLLESTREFWINCGIWSQIDQIKRIMVEPRRKEALGQVMSDYYAEVKKGCGAVFMAVCRGKVAEGLDFSDDNGRAVLLLGLPYPPFTDPCIELKRQFLDDQVMAKSGTLGGSKWYQLEAFRATNQAIGRVIRHSRDHGAVIFLDERFGDNMASQSLSKWLQPFFQKYDDSASAAQALKQFFKADGEAGKLRRAAVDEKPVARVACKSRRKPHVEIKMEEELKPSPPMVKDYLEAEENMDAVAVPRASNIFSTSKRRKIKLSNNPALFLTTASDVDLEARESEVCC